MATQYIRYPGIHLKKDAQDFYGEHCKCYWKILRRKNQKNNKSCL